MRREELKYNGETIHPQTDSMQVEHSGKTLYDILNTLDASTVDKLRNIFLSKMAEDSAKERITFEKGLTSTDGIFAELRDTLNKTQSTWEITRDQYGNSVLKVDKLEVKLEAIFKALTIEKLGFVAGGQIYSCCGMKCTSVTEGDTYYRCYTSDADTRNFQVGDLAICKVFTGDTKYYWKEVKAIGNQYIDLSKSGDGISVPAAGDEIIQLGNLSDTSRQGALIVESYPEPKIALYTGISSYTLNTDPVVISPSGCRFKGEMYTSAGGNVSQMLVDMDQFMVKVGASGINVTDEIITLTAGKTTFATSDGTKVAMFDDNGLNAQMINVESIDAQKMRCLDSKKIKKSSINEFGDGCLAYFYPNGNLLQRDAFVYDNDGSVKGMERRYYNLDGSIKRVVGDDGTSTTPTANYWVLKSVLFVTGTPTSALAGTTRTVSEFVWKTGEDSKTYNGKIADGSVTAGTLPSAATWLNGWVSSRTVYTNMGTSKEKATTMFDKYVNGAVTESMEISEYTKI